MLMMDTRPQLKGKYIHQAPLLGRYFADFLFPSHSLIVELDGSCHRGKLARSKDARRTADLAKAGYKVIRFWNSALRKGGVCERILAELEG